MDHSSLESKYDLITRVCKIANSSPDLHERLQMVVELVSEKMRTDTCSVYLMDGNSTLLLKASKGLHPDSVNHVTLKLNEGITGATASEKKTISSSEASSHSDFVYVPLTGEEQYQSIISTPIMSQEECIGVMNVQTVEKRVFSPGEIETLKILAEQLSGIIRNSNLYDKNAAGIQVLTAIYELSIKINATLNLPELLNILAKSICGIIKADCSAIWLKDENGNGFVKKCSHGEKADLYLNQTFKFCMDKMDKCERVCRVEEPTISDVMNHRVKMECSIEEDLRPKYLCVPLFSQSQLIGMVSNYRKKPHSKRKYYSETEKRLLALLANQAGLAIDNAMAHQGLENLNQMSQKQLRELNILYDSVQAMGANMNLDKCLRIILNAVTVGEGLGFNRAILFLTSEDGSFLQGMMGVGPSSPGEAGEIWRRLSHLEKSGLFEWLTQCADEPLDKSSGFNELAKSLRVPIRASHCVLARTVAEMKSFNVKDAGKSEVVNKELLEKLGSNKFATVPLMANEKTLGVILVDNLYTGAPISDFDLQFLSHFARQAGWMIHNSAMFTKLAEVNRELLLVRERLNESEHFAALGELSAEIAHEIKNPLLPIGGFARRLLEQLEDGTPARKYAGIIVEEVSRLEKLLGNVLNYTKIIEPHFTKGNLNSTIEEIISLRKVDLESQKIQLACQLDPKVTDTFFDSSQIKQVMNNLVSNAMESMAESGGELKISTQKGAGDEVIFKVSDTGGGIPKEVAKNIFNSFFTTKESGTGIGLPLVKKIVERHNGTIEVENSIGIGVTLVVVLPFNSPSDEDEN